MNAIIEVENEEEAELIRAGLADAETRAIVKVIAALLPVASNRARKCILVHAMDRLAGKGQSSSE